MTNLQLKNYLQNSLSKIMLKEFFIGKFGKGPSPLPLSGY
jgi:hypothetical protein